MNRIHLLAAGAVLMLAFTAVAQQATTGSDSRDGSGSMSAVEKHAMLLSEKLELNSDQQAKVKPILQAMEDSTERFLEDESMSRGERMDNVKAIRYKADRQLRKILNDEQRKKLDQLEEAQHSELHGN
jgi:Spy/CpxP family protein refolding chaperone